MACNATTNRREATAQRSTLCSGRGAARVETDLFAFLRDMATDHTVAMRCVEHMYCKARPPGNVLNECLQPGSLTAGNIGTTKKGVCG